MLTVASHCQLKAQKRQNNGTETYISMDMRASRVHDAGLEPRLWEGHGNNNKYLTYLKILMIRNIDVS